MEERSQSSDDDRSPNYYRGEGSPIYGQSSDREESQGAADGEGRSYDYQDGSYNSDERRHKRQKSEETLKQDRISAMPDAILLHILSFLPTEDAVKTGTLSQRWLYLWTCVPNLDFTCFSRMPDNIRRFVTFVDKTLILHKCCNVKKFTVDFHYDDSDDDFLPSRIDMWIRFATRANVEEFCINLNGRHDTNIRSYDLPHHVYNNSSMKKLSLSGCDVVPDGLICWKSLKRLSIGCSKLSEDLIQKILAGSPSLEFLELCGFYELNRLNIGSVSLRELVITDKWGEDSDDESELEISAPNLLSLGIIGTAYGKKFRLMDVQSLVDCKLNFDQSSYVFHNDTDYEVHENMLREILDRLRHVKKLTVGNGCLQVMTTLAMKVQFFAPSKRECLVLETYIEERDIPGIAGLLQSSFNLETLVLTFLEYPSMFWFVPPKCHWTLQEWRSKCSLKCLKTIEIVGFAERHLGFEHVIQLVQFLLESASVLEKMVIKAQKVDRYGLKSSPKGLLKVAQRLLSLPRSSPRAVVIFSE